MNKPELIKAICPICATTEDMEIPRGAAFYCQRCRSWVEPGGKEETNID